MKQLLFNEPLIVNLGWTLIHSLWQGAIIVVLCAGLLRLLRESSAQLRYLIACSALILIALFPIATIWRLSQPKPINIFEEATPAVNNSNEHSIKISTNNIDSIETNSTSPTLINSINHQQIKRGFSQLLPWLTLIWLIGVILLSLRLIGGLLRTQQLSRDQLTLMPDSWQQTVDRLAAQLDIKGSVKLFESALVQVPTVIGFLKPIILLPPGIILGLTPAQLESILLHELAHIKRYDYLINILQTTLEVLCFYHPGVWWLAQQIRIEREQICDDMVVAISNDAIVYAHALTKLERMRKAAPQLAVAANGGILLKRITRLINHQTHQKPSPFLLVSSIIITFFTLIVGVGIVQPLNNVAANSSTSATLLTELHDTGANSSVISTANKELASLISQDNLNGEDLSVRNIALSALGDQSGSIIVMDAKTGLIRTIVNQDWALKRSWSPASTIKLVTALTGINEKLFDPTEQLRSADQEKPLDLDHAIARSDNGYFKQLGKRIGSERITKYAQQLGYGEVTGINYQGEVAGTLPSVPNKINGGNLGTYGEGIKITPMQLAVMTAAIANGGTLMVPHIAANAQEGAKYQPQIKRRVNIPAESFARLIPGMLATVKEGTGATAYDANISIAGKTGTVDNGNASVGYFTSFAPANDPRYVVVVITKGKDVRGAVSAEIAGKIYRSLVSQ